MAEGSSRSREAGLWAVCALAALPLLGGCGVFHGDPIELFAASGERDGGAQSNAPCIDTAQAVTGSGQTVIGASAYDLIALVDGNHTSSFLWVSGDNTRVVLSVENPHVFSVVSRTNPSSDEPYSQRHCANYARIDATLRLSTLDGQLDERVAKISMTAFGDDEVRGMFVIEHSELKGTYTPNLRREHCFANSTFRFLIARDGTHGSQIDALGSGACQADGGALGTAPFAAGHWGVRWENY